MVSKKRKRTRGQQEVQVTRSQVDLPAEVAYIVGRAQEHEARCVTLGPLVFSTSAGDAWMLDPADAFALCLARDGTPQPVRILETEKSVGVRWDQFFRIDGDVFAVTDGAGQVTSFTNYPTDAILDAVQWAVEHQPPG